MTTNQDGKKYRKGDKVPSKRPRFQKLKNWHTGRYERTDVSAAIATIAPDGAIVIVTKDGIYHAP